MTLSSRVIQKLRNRIEIARLGKMQPNLQGRTSLFGGFRILDSESFLSQYSEIIVRESFRFDFPNPAPVIIDLGSNIGLPIRWWKYFWPQAEVHGYEPNPAAFAALVENTKNLEKTTIHETAVASVPGEVRLFDFGADASRITTPMEKNYQKYVSVESVTLSSILAEFENVDLLKIDIEGAELDVLREAAAALSKVRALFVEFHSFDLGSNFGELLNLLATVGFQVYPEARERLHKPFLSVPNDRGIAYTVNIWAWRE